LENVLEILDSLDRSLFVFLNGIHHPFFDFIMFWASDRFIWIPFYAVLVFLIIKKFGFESAYILASVALVLVISDQFTSGIMKPLFERFRPCHNPELMEYIHLVGRCGGRYGFASSMLPIHLVQPCFCGSCSVVPIRTPGFSLFGQGSFPIAGFIWGYIIPVIY
jgi:hypothetical protein